MNQSIEYMRHCARMQAVSIKPLTWLQFVSLSNQLEMMK